MQKIPTIEEAFFMWEEQKSRRFQELRQRQQEGQLNEAEQTELTLLVKELEDSEAAYLSSATQRLREERESLEDQNRSLETLVRRKEDLLRRLEGQATNLAAQLEQLGQGNSSP